MKYDNGRIKELRIAYIGGGSRGWAWKLMTDLAKEEALSGKVCLYDIDREAAEANAIIGNRLKDRKDVVGKWDYETAESLKGALTGADFVVISILPKTFDEMEADVHMPERLGIYQSVGDTAGPGGMMRALRTIPMFVEFAQAIKECCPEAWVINYTNPMTLCVKTLYQVFPEIKAFGCCHEVFGTQEMLAEIVAKELGAENVSREEICVNVLGINHFTWFDKASYKGEDIFPIYRRFISENFEEGIVKEGKNWTNDTFSCAHRVKMDLFNRYGLIAAAGDRHLAEFMPGEDYLKNPRQVKEWKFGLTTVQWRKEDLQWRLSESKALLLGEKEIELKETGEEGILLIKALCGLGRVISNVNIPNTAGQIANLPLEAVVETNAVFEKDMVRPVFAGRIPEQVKQLIMPHVENHERVMEVALGGCRDTELLTEAFLNDPLVKGRASEEEVRALVADMMAATL